MLFLLLRKNWMEGGKKKIKSNSSVTGKTGHRTKSFVCSNVAPRIV